MKPRSDGKTTDQVRARYLSEKYPHGSKHRTAKMYGGADSACALAAEKPILLMIVGSVRVKP